LWSLKPVLDALRVHAAQYKPLKPRPSQAGHVAVGSAVVLLHVRKTYT
jgi:hypothetical protein